MAKIQVLEKHVAELIAAGEVVERPASVIKELIENTIDAGARHVTVEIRDGGVTYMRITDDGCGMQREDVPTAFLRHATSKVRTQEDLAAIGTLGFRGEALASVAAVSKVEVTTCAAGEIVGTRYVIHGGEEQCLEDCGCAEGSTFIVEDLFYNIPARMKFLKKDVSEGNAVAGVVERLALSHPEIAFKFIRNGRTELQTAGDGQLLSCIHAVFGKQFASTLIPVEYTMGGVKVSGYVCKPENCRPNRTMQHYFVNDRYVKTQTGMVAVERAYKGMMMAGRFPACVLFIELSAEAVDANVHPAKIEVRFINEKPVFDAVYYGVRSALETRTGIQQVTFDKPVTPKWEIAPPVIETQSKKTDSFNTVPVSKPTPPSPIVRSKVESPRRSSFLDLAVDDVRPVTVSLQDGTARPKKPVAEDRVVAAVQPAAFTPREVVKEQPVQVEMETMPAVQLIGELFTTYILAQVGESLYIIDKHAAHERILYNQLKAQARTDEQMLLSPVAVTVSRDEHSALLESVEELAQAGITLEDFGGQCVLVRSFPLILSGTDIESTVREIAGGLVSGNREVQSAKLDWIYHSSACRAAIKAGDTSKPAELLELAQKVLTDDSIRFCPHGRPVCVEMTRKEIEKLFGRIV